MEEVSDRVIQYTLQLITLYVYTSSCELTYQHDNAKRMKDGRGVCVGSRHAYNKHGQTRHHECDNGGIVQGMISLFGH